MKQEHSEKRSEAHVVLDKYILCVFLIFAAGLLINAGLEHIGQRQYWKIRDAVSQESFAIGEELHEHAMERLRGAAAARGAPPAAAP